VDRRASGSSRQGLGVDAQWMLDAWHPGDLLQSPRRGACSELKIDVGPATGYVLPAEGGDSPVLCCGRGSKATQAKEIARLFDLNRDLRVTSWMTKAQTPFAIQSAPGSRLMGQWRSSQTPDGRLAAFLDVGLRKHRTEFGAGSCTGLGASNCPKPRGCHRWRKTGPVMPEKPLFRALSADGNQASHRAEGDQGSGLWRLSVAHAVVCEGLIIPGSHAHQNTRLKNLRFRAIAAAAYRGQGGPPKPIGLLTQHHPRGHASPLTATHNLA